MKPSREGSQEVAQARLIDSCGSNREREGRQTGTDWSSTLKSQDLTDAPVVTTEGF